MDRRDRVSVLACDVTCRAMPGGFRAPGRGGGARRRRVPRGDRGRRRERSRWARCAARRRVSGRDAGHDLRVVLLSDGVASAGYRGPSRVVRGGGRRAARRARRGGRGAHRHGRRRRDARRDRAGGGGAVVPYMPGQALDAAALDVLSATYGAALRDVEITLPDGLRDVAPAKLATIRAGRRGARRGAAARRSRRGRSRSARQGGGRAVRGALADRRPRDERRGQRVGGADVGVDARRGRRASGRRRVARRGRRRSRIASGCPAA